jgi:hypothetical protein
VAGGGWSDGSSETKANLAQMGLELGLGLAKISSDRVLARLPLVEFIPDTKLFTPSHFLTTLIKKVWLIMSGTQIIMKREFRKMLTSKHFSMHYTGPTFASLFYLQSNSINRSCPIISSRSSAHKLPLTSS